MFFVLLPTTLGNQNTLIPGLKARIISRRFSLVKQTFFVENTDYGSFSVFINLKDSI